jgi:ABC-type branched-subunit amino acid transport system ATPase component
MLRVSGVSKAFGAFRVLHKVELDAAARAITGVIGPNGAGKSTLINVVAGLMKPDTGRIVLDEVDITSLAPHKRALRGLVRTFQISRELGELTVLENLLFARPNQAGEAVWKAFVLAGRVRKEERAAVNRAHTILERVGLWRLADHPARGLSGGQKKLLELCRALMLAPKVVLLDEPAAGVSPPMREEISRVIRTLCDEGITIVIVEHDMDLVANICDHVYVLAEGANLTCGSFKEIVSDQRVVDAYLGGLR